MGNPQAMEITSCAEVPGTVRSPRPSIQTSGRRLHFLRTGGYVPHTEPASRDMEVSYIIGVKITYISERHEIAQHNLKTVPRTL